MSTNWDKVPTDPGTSWSAKGTSHRNKLWGFFSNTWDDRDGLTIGGPGWIPPHTNMYWGWAYDPTPSGPWTTYSSQNPITPPTWTKQS
jgi:hypothetical protein